MPKALVEVDGQSLLERVIKRLADANFDHLVVNVHHFSGQIIDFLRDHDNFGLDIQVSDETDALLDTGGGIRKAQQLFDLHYPILIHNVDILSNLDLDRFYRLNDKTMWPRLWRAPCQDWCSAVGQLAQDETLSRVQ